MVLTTWYHPLWPYAPLSCRQLNNSLGPDFLPCSFLFGFTFRTPAPFVPAPCARIHDQHLHVPLMFLLYLCLSPWRHPTATLLMSYSCACHFFAPFLVPLRRLSLHQSFHRIRSTSEWKSKKYLNISSFLAVTERWECLLTLLWVKFRFADRTPFRVPEVTAETIISFEKHRVDHGKLNDSQAR